MAFEICPSCSKFCRVIDDGKCPFCAAQVCEPIAEGPVVADTIREVSANETHTTLLTKEAATKVVHMQEWLERKGFKPLGPKRNGVI